MRRFVIGDIHGCSKALRTLLQEIHPRSADELVFLGDYVDRGPDSRDVVEQVMRLQSRCRVVALRGNHEVMLMGVAMGGCDPETWLRSGGHATVASYGGSISKVPEKHLNFFRSLKPAYETDREIFVHAMYDPYTGVMTQSDELTYWTHLPAPLPPPHRSGKRVFVGHTPQANGEILYRAHLVGIDTYCFGGGYLSALNLEDDTVLQADRHGHLRRMPIERAMHLVAWSYRRCGRWVRVGRYWVRQRNRRR